MLAEMVDRTVQEGGSSADMVDTAQIHIGLWYLVFLHQPANAAVIFQLGDSKIAGVVDAFDAQQGLGLVEDIPDVVFADGVSEDDEYFVFTYDAAGKQDGMADALSFVLIDKMSGQLRVFLLYKVLYFLVKIAYNENKLSNSGFH